MITESKTLLSSYLFDDIPV